MHKSLNEITSSLETITAVHSDVTDLLRILCQVLLWNKIYLRIMFSYDISYLTTVRYKQLHAASQKFSLYLKVS